VALAYLDSELLASPSLEEGSFPVSTSVTGVTGREEIGSMVGRERQSTTACPNVSSTDHDFIFTA